MAISTLTIATLSIAGVCCGSEKPLVQASLSQFPFIFSYELTIKNKAGSPLVIIFDSKVNPLASITDGLAKSGFKAMVSKEDIIKIDSSKVTENASMKMANLIVFKNGQPIPKRNEKDVHEVS